jgi:hypothetical protein
VVKHKRGEIQMNIQLQNYYLLKDGAGGKKFFILLHRSGCITHRLLKGWRAMVCHIFFCCLPTAFGMNMTKSWSSSTTIGIPANLGVAN